MLDWTTSFLSDETIIKPREKSVKHFLGAHNIWEELKGRILPVGRDGKMSDLLTNS
jgi:hypothetical protein